MDFNHTILTDPSALSKDELIDGYEKLSKFYKILKEDNDLNQQTIYELKRNLHTALNGEAFLNSELESISSIHMKEIEEITKRNQYDIEDLKLRNSNLSKNYSSLENELLEMREKVSSLTKELNEKSIETSICLHNKSNGESQEKILKIENENFELLELVESLKEQLNTALKKIVQLESFVEDFQDKCCCLEENLQSKKDELDEKNQLYDTMQEKVILLSGEIASLKSDPNSGLNRGNSLFAEVDDQRQKIKQQLVHQQKYFVQMKKEFTNSQHEIRHLKRENAAIHKELQICSSLFVNSDRSYREKLNEQISQLMNEKEVLSKKLELTESRLIQTAKDHGVKWLDSMLQFCKDETKKLKEQLHCCRLEKSSTEMKLLNAEQDAARWRFEALKSRCIIISREATLEENKIQFDDLANIDLNLKKIDQPTAMPNIKDESNEIFKLTKITKAITSPLKQSSIKTSVKSPLKKNAKENSLKQEMEKDLQKDTETNDPVECSQLPDQDIFKQPANKDSAQQKEIKSLLIMPTSSQNNQAFVSPECDSKVTVLTEYRKINLTPQDKDAIRRFNSASNLSRRIQLDGIESLLKQPNTKTVPNAKKSVHFSKTMMPGNVNLENIQKIENLQITDCPENMECEKEIKSNIEIIKNVETMENIKKNVDLMERSDHHNKENVLSNIKTDGQSTYQTDTNTSTMAKKKSIMVVRRIEFNSKK